MNHDANVSVLLKSRPIGLPKLEDFDIVSSEIPVIGEGEVLLEILWISLDPYMRGRMNDAKSYAPSVRIGEPMIAGVVAQIKSSRTPLFVEGDIVEGRSGWQKYAVSDGIGLRKIDPALAPIQTAVGILGMPGLTAYFGFLDVCEPKPGDIVVVSAASGAVGQVVGQIAKLMGCLVIGTAGTDEKVSYIVNDLGFDYGINYRSQNIGESLDKYCPDGIDIYFDNVGGELTDLVMERLKIGARISVCGQISQYNNSQLELGPRNMGNLVKSQAKMQGFLVFAYEYRYPQALERMADWISKGKLKYKEDIVDGIENAPKTFIGMLNGENFGKTLIRI
jgi:NADPH-dependent curcumin reductase CurA